MVATKIVLAWVRRVLIVVFCSAHLLFLLTNNLPGDMRKDIIDRASNIGEKTESGNTPAYDAVQQYLDVARGYERLTAASQNWGMFAPNVGDTSEPPCMVVFYTDGVQEMLLSVTQPRLLNVPADFNFLLKFSELEKRKEAEPNIMDVSWPLHLGDARIRKIESYVVKRWDMYGLNGPRQAWIRWRLIDHLRRNPSRQGRVERVHLFRANYQHPHNGAGPGYGKPYLTGVNLLAEYKPSLDPAWPKDLPAEPAK